jgi:transcriptional regulator with GAF, ATPase, and Fis domain
VPASPDQEVTRIVANTAGKLHAIDLVVAMGPDRGLARRLTHGRVRIGTGPANDLRLTDPTVSGVHCELELKDGGVRIVDSGSTNGTIVNGLRVYDADVRSGATVSLGDTVLRLDVAEEAIPVEVSDREQFGEVLGRSFEMRRIYAIVEKVAASNTTILIQGETGTGKDALARAIHDASSRAAAPFVAVDCGSLAENLIESELFGHARGAFSGAVAERKGLLEAARGGTVFLDEIGELPLALQPKLLRALEVREIRRVGENDSRSVDVRVIAATNRPLARSVNEGHFREDLYYRLAVVEIHVPPLRARREDIPILAQHFYERFSGRDDQLPPELTRSMMTRAWPGNVRELRNFVERSVALGWASHAPSTSAPSSEPPVGLAALVPDGMALKDAREEWTRRFERLYLGAILRRSGGNVRKAAEGAGINRRTLQRMMAEHGIRSADVGNEPESDE